MTDLHDKGGWRRRQMRESPGVATLPDQAFWANRIARGAFAYGVLVLLVTAFFVHIHHLPVAYVVGAAPLGMLFGVAIHGFERLAATMRRFLAEHVNRAMRSFVLFFIYIICYVLFFSLIVTYPLGYAMEKGTGSAAIATEYGLYSLNFILFFAILGWLDWGRLVAEQAEHFFWRRARPPRSADEVKTLDNER